MKRTPLIRKARIKAKAPMKRGGKLKASKPKMTPIRKSARGEKCTARIPGACNGDPETTVLAHRNGAGMSCKAEDHDAAYTCSGCHWYLDGGYVQFGHSRQERDRAHDSAILETQNILARKGLYNPEAGAA